LYRFLFTSRLLTNGRRKDHVFQTENTKKGSGAKKGEKTTDVVYHTAEPEATSCRFLELRAGMTLFGLL
jgi:hypothetical protein